MCHTHTRFFREKRFRNEKEKKKMCPLRFILVFLSATLAGFFVLRKLRSQPQIDDDDAVLTNPKISDTADSSSNENSKVHPFHPFASISRKRWLFLITLIFVIQVRAVVESGFWTFVDMASGRYLWRHLVSNSEKKSCWCCENLWLYVSDLPTIDRFPGLCGAHNGWSNVASDIVIFRVNWDAV